MVAKQKKKILQLKDVFETLGYKLRFEKGHFNAGLCVVHDKKVIVINKFFDEETQLQTLQSIFEQIEFDQSKLNQQQLDLLKKLNINIP